MSFYRVFVRRIRNEQRGTSSIFLKSFPDISARFWYLRNYGSHPESRSNKSSIWYSFIKRWQLTLPVGIGVSLLGILQWRHLKKHPYPERQPGVQEPFNDFVVTCYRCLPLRITSRLWGWIASIEVPVSLRPALYGFYAKTFSANLEEIDVDLSSFPSLVDFFVRPLKEDVRPIAQHTNIVSPSDGTVLHLGVVKSCLVEQVKGVTYDLRHFLGDTDEKNKQLSDDDYIKSLLKNSSNQLYQLIVYLAPGDYHRFHSSTDWEINYRKHFDGKLLSVNPKIASYLPNLFSLNERVVYIGTWASGFMAYVAVGATNVGSIKVYCDKDLTTNSAKWPKAKRCNHVDLDWTHVDKGELFGEFRMGSTIVLLFEAPKDFQFCLEVGQSVKVGQALSEHIVKFEENRQAAI